MQEKLRGQGYAYSNVMTKQCGAPRRETVALKRYSSLDLLSWIRTETTVHALQFVVAIRVWCPIKCWWPSLRWPCPRYLAYSCCTLYSRKPCFRSSKWILELSGFLTSLLSSLEMSSGWISMKSRALTFNSHGCSILSSIHWDQWSLVDKQVPDTGHGRYIPIENLDRASSLWPSYPLR